MLGWYLGFTRIVVIWHVKLHAARIQYETVKARMISGDHW